MTMRTLQVLINGALVGTLRDEDNIWSFQYAATWLGDAGMTGGPEFDAAMGQWLDMFADDRCEAVGFGWCVLAVPEPAATPSAKPWILVEDLSHSPRLPWGDEVRDFLAGCGRVEATSLPELLTADLRLADGVVPARVEEAS